MKFTRPRKLHSKDVLLAIYPNCEITSTKDSNDPYGNPYKSIIFQKILQIIFYRFLCVYFLTAILQVISISANMIAMWGKEAQLYLAINQDGRVYATVSCFLFKTRYKG